MTAGRALERVLVRLPNWLGDALMARPLLHALRAAQPRAEIVAVGPAGLLALLATERTFDRAETWPKGRADRARLLARLRVWRPEAALVLPPSFSSAWFAWRAGARIRIGFAQDGRSPLLTHAVRRPARGERHLSREYLDLGARLGATAVPVPALVLDDSARAEAARLRASLPGGARYVVLGPGARYGPAKRWPPERFVELGMRCRDRGLAVLVCGGAEDAVACEAVARGIGAGAGSLAGRTSLAGQAALCAEARVAVCNDSGLAHLAAATGARTVAIFGSTSSAWTAPVGAGVQVVQRAPVCSPCFQRTCAIGYRCLSAVTVNAVWHATSVADAAAGSPA